LRRGKGSPRGHASWSFPVMAPHRLSVRHFNSVSNPRLTPPVSRRNPLMKDDDAVFSLR
jgi:hypothetical protein